MHMQLRLSNGKECIWCYKMAGTPGRVICIQAPKFVNENRWFSRWAIVQGPQSEYVISFEK